MCAQVTVTRMFAWSTQMEQQETVHWRTNRTKMKGVQAMIQECPERLRMKGLLGNTAELYIRAGLPVARPSPFDVNRKLLSCDAIGEPIISLG